MLRYAADIRTVIWIGILAPALVAVAYCFPEKALFLAPLCAYFALSAGVIAHNHNHCPTFRARRMNAVFGNWLSIFYGYPTFGWIPTHNLNHHRFVNRRGDATITWRLTPRHNLLAAATYFFVSSYYQGEPIKRFIREARLNKPRVYRSIVGQYVTVAAVHLLMLGLAVALYGPVRGGLLWLLVLGLPAFFSLFTIMLFNYEQHVHADPGSKLNHSRNFEGRVLNFLLFNNGLHTAHHESPGTHWSRLPEAHARLRADIDARLLEKSLWVYWTKQYLLAPFFPSLGTQQVGRAASEYDGFDVTEAQASAV